MDEVEVVGNNFRLDREWGIYDPESKIALTNANFTELTEFRLRFLDPETLQVTHPKAEKDLIIDINAHPQEQANAVKICLYREKEGFVEKQEINEWFSAILNKKVWVVRASTA